MSIIPEEFLLFAEEILECDNVREIYYRNIISRSYYYAYHAIKPYVKFGPKEHRDFAQYLMDKKKLEQEPLCTDKLFEIGSLLEGLRWRRIEADYKLEKHVFIENAKICIATARKLEKQIEELIK